MAIEYYQLEHNFFKNQHQIPDRVVCNSCGRLFELKKDTIHEKEFMFSQLGEHLFQFNHKDYSFYKIKRN